MSDLRVSNAALRLSVTPQTVRNWIRSGTLKAKKDNGIWVVDSASVERCAAARPLPAAGVRADGGTEKRLEDLTAVVAALVARERSAEDLLEALQRERDRFRSEAATAKEAALRVNAAARETQAAVRQLLAVLELQTDALTQLLVPSSLEDLVP
jgi:Helix-turn-helix domain